MWEGGHMVAWLHDHATEVQAAAAVVQALAAGVTVALTAVLVWATRRYVRLTADLARAATAEAERHRLAAETRRLKFLAVVARLELLVERLPEDRSESRIRAALVWTDDDVKQLLALAPGIRSEERRVGKECRMRWSA